MFYIYVLLRFESYWLHGFLSLVLSYVFHCTICYMYFSGSGFANLRRKGACTHKKEFQVKGHEHKDEEGNPKTIPLHL